MFPGLIDETKATCRGGAVRERCASRNVGGSASSSGGASSVAPGQEIKTGAPGSVDGTWSLRLRAGTAVHRTWGPVRRFMLQASSSVPDARGAAVGPPRRSRSRRTVGQPSCRLPEADLRQLVTANLCDAGLASEGHRPLRPPAFCRRLEAASGLSAAVPRRVSAF